MRELNIEERSSVSGGKMDKLTLAALSVTGGTLFGAGVGTFFAMNNVWQLTLLPIWVAAGAGAGGAIGTVVGITVAIGGLCI